MCSSFLKILPNPILAKLLDVEFYLPTLVLSLKTGNYLTVISSVKIMFICIYVPAKPVLANPLQVFTTGQNYISIQLDPTFAFQTYRVIALILHDILT